MTLWQASPHFNTKRSEQKIGDSPVPSRGLLCRCTYGTSGTKPSEKKIGESPVPSEEGICGTLTSPPGAREETGPAATETLEKKIRERSVPAEKGIFGRFMSTQGARGTQAPHRHPAKPTHQHTQKHA